MEMNCQFHSLASLPWEYATLCPRSRRLDGPQCRSEILEKSTSSGSYQNRSPKLSARRINKLLLFIIIVITDFSLTGLDLKVLKIDKEMCIICEAKETVLNVEIRG
jgi:hypothetical protein